MRNFPEVGAVGQAIDSTEYIDFLAYVKKAWTSEVQVPDEWKNIFDQYELKKTPEEKRMIALAEKTTNAFVKKYGGSGFHIDQARIHLLPKSAFSLSQQFKGIDGGGTAFPFAGQIVLTADQVRRHPVEFLRVLMHEEAHVKSFLSVTLGKHAGFRRQGFSIDKTSEQEHASEKAFIGLDEALTEESAYDCLIEAVRDPSFFKIVQSIPHSTEKRTRARYAKKNQIPPNEVLWALSDASDGGVLSYFLQRSTFTYLIGKICTDNPTSLSKPAELRALFYRAKYRGNLLPVARLIEQSFGKGAFRIVAEMGRNPDDWSCLEKLRKRRK